MIDDNLFDPEAPMFQPKRYIHAGCSTGKDPCLIVTRTESGWLWVCHRCKRKGFKPVKGLSIEKTIKFINASKNHIPVVDDQAVELPEDSTTALPKHVKKKVLRYLEPQDIEQYRVVYSTSYNRIIFPYYSNNTMIYWIGRTLDEVTKENPKWLMKRVKRYKHNTYSIWKKEVNRVVLVEDIYSCHKVSKVVNCTALLGTYMPDKMLKLPFEVAYLWLDADALNLSMKYQRKFNLHGKKCQIIYTDKDPKEYTYEEIEGRII